MTEDTNLASNYFNRSRRVTLSLTPSIHDALAGEAKANQRELTEHIQRVLAEQVIMKRLIQKEEADRIRLMWSLVDRTVTAAQQICRDGGFSSSITLDAIRACKKDPKWIDDYREFVRDDIYKNGNPLKGVVNREIGFRIRAGIGGVTVKDETGKAAVAKVLGEIIQSYTPMESFDPLVVRSALSG